MGTAQANARRPKCSKFTFGTSRSNPPAERCDRRGACWSSSAMRYCGMPSYTALCTSTRSFASWHHELFISVARSHNFDLGWKIGKYAAKSGGEGGGIQPLVTAWAQILIGGGTNTEPSLPQTACQRTFQPEANICTCNLTDSHNMRIAKITWRVCWPMKMPRNVKGASTHKL